MSIKFTSTPTPVMPSLCEPFDFSAEAQCTAAGLVEFGKFRTTFEPFQCTPGGGVVLSANEDDNRKRCVIAGKPLLQEEYNDMANNFDAITVNPLTTPPLHLCHGAAWYGHASYGHGM
jgi:hypothetical protein